jgi:hypothetical protein
MPSGIAKGNCFDLFMVCSSTWDDRTIPAHPGDACDGQKISIGRPQDLIVTPVN